MNRILRLPALAGAIVAAVCLVSLTPNSDAGPYGYYRGGYGPGYGAYSANPFKLSWGMIAAAFLREN